VFFSAFLPPLKSLRNWSESRKGFNFISGQTSEEKEEKDTIESLYSFIKLSFAELSLTTF